jgi:putative FmdB family regulatory protein
LVPRYDYECPNCHNVFEVKQSYSSEPVATCPECANGARRVFRAVPIVFKGSGFYVNDYGKGNSFTSEKPDSKKSDTAAESTNDKADKADKTESKTEKASKD